MIYKEIEGVGSVTLMTRVMGFGELQWETSDRDLCSSFVTESAWPTWGVPLLLTYPSVFFMSRLIGLRSPMVSLGGDLVLLFLSPAWGCEELPVCGGALVLVPGVQ